MKKARATSPDAVPTIDARMREAVAAAVESGWSLKTLSEATGINYSAMYRWFHCVEGKTLTIDSAQKLLNLFAIHIGTPRKMPKPPVRKK